MRSTEEIIHQKYYRVQRYHLIPAPMHGRAQAHMYLGEP